VQAIAATREKSNSTLYLRIPEVANRKITRSPRSHLAVVRPQARPIARLDSYLKGGDRENLFYGRLEQIGPSIQGGTMSKDLSYQLGNAEDSDGAGKSKTHGSVERGPASRLTVRWSSLGRIVSTHEKAGIVSGS